MTTCELLAAVKAYVSGDVIAGQTLADAFEEAGDGEGAALLRSGTFTMAFDHPEARGSATMRRGNYGPDLLLGAAGGEYVAAIDLPSDYRKLPTLIVFDGVSQDWAVKCEINPDASVEVNVNTRAIEGCDPNNDGPVFRSTLWPG
jgi:hypothetical protein